ncbi:MAG TPA: OmpH family outer membrane protein [Sphingomonas sp.]|jgi:Skp family chaperone for outer membrane proteins|nr:OmpH family outer membrane protein [Sphingomonas sp.]
MTMLKSIMLMAAAAAPIATVTAIPAHAQVAGVAVADPEAAIQNSNAWKTALSQIQTTHKTALDQANARAQATQNELRPLVQALQTASRAPNANQAQLQQQANTIQQKEQAAQAEINRLTQPAQLARAYVLEQINRQLNPASQAVISQQKLQLLLRPEALLWAGQATDVTAAITGELNRLVPSVSITPPAGWQPGGQQQAAQQPAQPTQPAPQGR